MADATAAPPSMMSAPSVPEERIPPRRLFAFLIMVFGMFMSILDIQIVSASLAEIQAGLSASSSEVSWVQTSYLIAEVIGIPLTGLLTRVFSLRWLSAGAIAAFTLASIGCAYSTGFEQLIFWTSLSNSSAAGLSFIQSSWPSQFMARTTSKTARMRYS